MVKFFGDWLPLVIVLLKDLPSLSFITSIYRFPFYFQTHTSLTDSVPFCSLIEWSTGKCDRKKERKKEGTECAFKRYQALKLFITELEVFGKRIFTHVLKSRTLASPSFATFIVCFTFKHKQRSLNFSLFWPLHHSSRWLLHKSFQEAIHLLDTSRHNLAVSFCDMAWCKWSVG